MGFNTNDSIHQYSYLRIMRLKKKINTNLRVGDRKIETVGLAETNIYFRPYGIGLRKKNANTPFFSNADVLRNNGYILMIHNALFFDIFYWFTLDNAEKIDIFEYKQDSFISNLAHCVAF